MDGWVRVIRPFNIISVISRRWKGEHERLCAMKRRLGSGRLSPPGGFEPATPWTEVGSANRSATRTLLMGKWCLNASSFIFERIIIKVAGNQDGHKSSDEFDFGPLVSMAHLYVFWNEIWPWHIGLRCAIVALWATCLSIPQVGKGYVRYDLSALVKTEKTLVRNARNNFLCNRTSLLNVWSLLCYGRIRSYATLIAYELHVQQYSLGYVVFEC